VARVLDCNVLDERCVRPADFDLAAYWQAATIRLEAEMHPNFATVRLSPFGVKLLNALSQPYVRTRTRIEETADAAGWRIAVVPIGKTVWHAAAELLRLGAEAEVLAPAELRDRMAELTQAMAARYQSNCAEVARRSAGLKAGAGAPPPTAATALTPPVHRSVGFASARSRTERGRVRSVSSAHSGWDPISAVVRSWC
jgi:NADPH-dependent glutamate synthase beta subunit-like oxidoreductase